MSKPLVSWLMPVYNSECTIRRALDSILSSIYQNFIVIIVVEFSCCDRTLEICEDYAKSDSRIRVFLNERYLGLSGSLNRGLKLCEGKYVARLNADDCSHPERLEKQIEFMENHPETGVLFTNRRTIEDGFTNAISQTSEHEEIRTGLLFSSSRLCHSTAMLNLDEFRQNGWNYPIDKSVDDYALWASLISKTRFACLSDMLTDCYVSNDNAQILTKNQIKSKSAQISRDAIKNELNVDTTHLDDIFFDLQHSYAMPQDMDRDEFLFSAIELLSRLSLANRNLQVFSSSVLNTVLHRRLREYWSFSGLLYPYDLSLMCFDESGLFHKIMSRIQEATQSLYSADTSVIIYGTGRYCAKLLTDTNNKLPFDVLAFCDSNKAKHGSQFYGKTVISPEGIGTCQYDVILIASPFYEEEIAAHLTGVLNAPPEKVCSASFCLIKDILKYCYEKYLLEKSSLCKRAFLFCAPDYDNIGDHAIAVAEHKFFSQHFDCSIIEVPSGEYETFLPVVNKYITPNDLILITGGGFLGSLWFHMELQARNVIAAYTNNRIIILPQTLYWEDSAQWKAEKTNSSIVYSKHPNLTLSARDLESFRLMKESYPDNNVILAPDMVLSQEWTDYFDSDATRKGAIICLKDDKESILSQNDRDLISAICQKLCGFSQNISTVISSLISMSERDELLREKLQEFRNAELVITDRLHGLIFAAVTGTPCIALNNCNHKIRETFNWISDIPNVRFSENIIDIEEHAHRVLNIGVLEWARLPSFETLICAINEAYAR